MAEIGGGIDAGLCTARQPISTRGRGGLAHCHTGPPGADQTDATLRPVLPHLVDALAAFAPSATTALFRLMDPATMAPLRPGRRAVIASVSPEQRRDGADPPEQQPPPVQGHRERSRPGIEASRSHGRAGVGARGCTRSALKCRHPSSFPGRTAPPRARLGTGTPKGAQPAGGCLPGRGVSPRSHITLMRCTQKGAFVTHDPPLDMLRETACRAGGDLWRGTLSGQHVRTLPWRGRFGERLISYASSAGWPHGVAFIRYRESVTSEAALTSSDAHAKSCARQRSCRLV